MQASCRARTASVRRASARTPSAKGCPQSLAAGLRLVAVASASKVQLLGNSSVPWACRDAPYVRCRFQLCNAAYDASVISLSATVQCPVTHQGISGGSWVLPNKHLYNQLKLKVPPFQQPRGALVTTGPNICKLTSLARQSKLRPAVAAQQLGYRSDAAGAGAKVLGGMNSGEQRWHPATIFVLMSEAGVTS